MNLPWTTPAAGALRAAALAAGLLALDVACGGGPPPDPAAQVIARVGSRRVTRGDFEAFLTATLGGPPEVAAADAEVKSRLLDQYLDDEMLVGAALDAGLKVSDDDVREFQPNGIAGGEQSIRRILLTRQYKQKVILKDVSVSEEEIRGYFERHLNEYRQPARIVLRQILLDSAQEAKRIRAELGKDPDRFEEVAETRSLAPDGGKPYPLEEALLPEALHKAVEHLNAGDLSEVVQDPQGYFILKLESRQPEKAPNLEEARQRISLRLLQDRGQQKYAEFVSDLRGRTKVSIEEDKLGFRYVKKAGA